VAVWCPGRTSPPAELSWRFWSRRPCRGQGRIGRRTSRSLWAMLESGLIDSTILVRLIDRLPASLDPQVQERLHAWLKAWVDRHGPDLTDPCHATAPPMS
jgi:hypothetical protein